MRVSLRTGLMRRLNTAHAYGHLLLYLAAGQDVGTGMNFPNATIL